MLAHVVIEAAQNIFAAVDQRDLAAKACKYSGEFDCNVAAALN